MKPAFPIRADEHIDDKVVASVQEKLSKLRIDGEIPNIQQAYIQQEVVLVDYNHAHEQQTKTYHLQDFITQA